MGRALGARSLVGRVADIRPVVEGDRAAGIAAAVGIGRGFAEVANTAVVAQALVVAAASAVAAAEVAVGTAGLGP